MRPERSGFSLLEVMVSMVLLAVLAGVGLGGLASDRGRATSEGMAMTVAAELEAVRAKAISSGIPAAFCLPTANGTVPNSQSFYLMEGEVMAATSSQRNLSADFPDSSMAFVYWGPDASLQRPARAGSAAANTVDLWLGDKVGKDFALVFLPDGAVMSNDLPLVDGEYRLVVASSLQALPGTVPDGPGPMRTAPQNFQLQEVFAAHTISISPQGMIRLESGVPQPQGVKIATGRMASSSAPAQAHPPAPAASTVPAISNVTVYPKPFLDPKATVQQERNLSLTVEAMDVDGQPLYCTWKSEPVGSAADHGPFSLEAEHPMTWSAERRCWVSQCTWAPPAAANVGDQYVLTCTVKDSEGNEVSKTADILNPVTVIPPGRILFEGRRGTKTDVAIINADGTGLRFLTDGANDDSSPALSPDGSKIAWVNANDGAKGEVWVMNVDGSGKTRLTNNTSNEFSAGWTPDGLRVMYSRNWPDQIRSVNPDGTGEALLGTIHGSSSYEMVASPDGKYLLNVSNLNAPGQPSVSGEIIVSEYVSNGTNAPILRDSTNVTNNSLGRTVDQIPTFIPQSSDYRLVWSSFSPGPSGNFSDAICELTVARLQDNGAGAANRFELVDRQVIRTDGIGNLIFSPDARKVLYVNRLSAGIYLADWNDDGVNPPTLTNARLLTGLAGYERPRAWIR